MKHINEINNVKLDKYDKTILFELDKNCRVHLARLAKKVKRSRQSVEYRINNMVNAGIISSFSTAINPSKMGYRLYKVYLQMKNIEKEREKLIEFLRSSGNVYWMGECDGEWDIIFAVSAKNEKEFFDFKNLLFAKFGGIIIKHYGDILVDVRQYVKMYFTDDIEKPTMFAGEVEHNELDKVDSRILIELMKNARMSVNDLARTVDTTPSIVRSRMQKMEKLGIIIQYRIGINLEKLDMQLFKAIIHFDKYTEGEEKRFISFCSSLKNIHYLIRNMWQIEVELAVNSYKEYNQLLNMIKRNFPNLIRNVESVLMKTDEWTPGYKKIVS